MLTLLCTAVVYGISRISEPDLKAVNFAKAIAAHRLNGSVIKEMEVDSESSCQFECGVEEKCQSYNFGTKKNNPKRFKCQLSDSDRYSGHVNFTEDQDFIYRGRLVNCFVALDVIENFSFVRYRNSKLIFKFYFFS